MDSDPALGDAEWVYLPAPVDTTVYTDLGMFEVSGESFAVRRSEHGMTHFDWVSGPNEGYGFSVFGSGQVLSDQQITTEIRGFLSGINPDTGYLD